jgi:hypothetical protein
LPDEEIIGNMLKALFHWNYKIRNAAAENLQYFYKQSAGSKMIETAIYSGNWTSAQLSKFQTVFVN